MTSTHSPLKISVVTVCYNAVDTIEETILSVINQTYDNVEYIIIDGGSTDGTVDIIRKYADGSSEALNHRHRITYWVSEPDKGIYDAMNKGIAVATGDYINFMNAGDSFYENSILSKIASRKCMGKVTALCGATIINFFFGKYRVSPPKPLLLKREMCYCHQSVFVRADIQRKFPFDSNLRISADHKSLLSIYLDNPDTFFVIDEVVALYDGEKGVSSTNIRKSSVESSSFSIQKYSLYRKIRLKLREKFKSKSVYRIYFSLNPRFKRIY